MNSSAPTIRKTMELFTQAMEIWVRELPDVYRRPACHPLPDDHPLLDWLADLEEDAYGFPHSWQQEFLKTILRLEPTS